MGVSPFKAFSIPVEAFYESRYNKIALAMRDIDTLFRSAGADL